MEIGDKVNVGILFLNDELKGFSENLFFIKDVEIIDKSDYDEDVFILSKIKNIRPFRIDDDHFVPLTGYEFHFRKNRIDDVDYASSYGCYFIVSYENDENKLKYQLIQHIINDDKKRSNALKEELNNLDNEINSLLIIQKMYE